MYTYKYKINAEKQQKSPPGDFSCAKTLGHIGLMCFLLLAMTGLMFQKASAQVNINEDDSLALVALYHEAGGADWRNSTGWLVDPITTGSWHGITTEEVEEGEWRVTRIDLRANNLTGTFPDEMKDLEHVFDINVRENLMSGPFPDVLMDMPRLRRATLAPNYFSGEVPWEKVYSSQVIEQFSVRGAFFDGSMPTITEGSMPMLNSISIQGNFFTGDFPTGWENLQSLRTAELHMNRFTGSLDNLSGLAEVEAMERLMLERNYLLTPGEVPGWIANMADNLQRLTLNGTKRIGAIPDWIGGMHELRVLRFGGGDEIGGAIPDQLGFLERLNTLRLDSANFDGPIPDWLGHMPGLSYLELIDNNFTGTIPTTFNESSIGRLVLIRLNLDGPMPNLGGMSLNRLVLKDIGFEVGAIPDWLGEHSSMNRLALEGLGLTGNLADYEFLNTFSNLQRIMLQNNPDLTGDVPSWIINLENLQLFNVSRTGLNITEVPTWLQDHTDLWYVGLAGLGLTGDIPGWLGDLPSLNVLALEDNELTGGIPAEFGNLSFMDSLNVSNNQLEGELPPSIVNMGIFEGITTLNALMLSGNADLSGEIPLGVVDSWDPGILRILEYEGTQLCEPEDQSFEDWLSVVETHPNPTDPTLNHSVKRSDQTGCGTTSVPPNERAYVFGLDQNYPNPFNPTTIIQYEIPADAHVRLSIYNVLGQRVATLVNEQKGPGRYEVNFDAARMASGSYIYRLEAGGRTQTQTMMLIK